MEKEKKKTGQARRRWWRRTGREGGKGMTFLAHEMEEEGGEEYRRQAPADGKMKRVTTTIIK